MSEDLDPIEKMLLEDRKAKESDFSIFKVIKEISGFYLNPEVFLTIFLFAGALLTFNFSLKSQTDSPVGIFREKNFGVKLLEETRGKAIPSQHMIRGVPTFSQIGQTCSPTCLSMIMTYNKMPYHNFERVIRESKNFTIKRPEDVANDPVTGFGENGKYYSAEDFLIRFGEVFLIQTTRDPFKNLKIFISNNFPIMVGIRLPRQTGYHAVVITGYNDISQEIIGNDPWGSEFYWSYQSFLEKWEGGGNYGLVFKKK